VPEMIYYRNDNKDIEPSTLAGNQSRTLLKIRNAFVILYFVRYFLIYQRY